MKRVGVIGIQGLPARYGAFEQTVSQIVNYANSTDQDFEFYVPCTRDVSKEKYHGDNIFRKSILRIKGPGVILYCLLGFIWCYMKGCRTFFFFGYTLSPLFSVFRMLGADLICNVDGFEWRRRKWGKFAKSYFKFCECRAARSKAKLIFDSSAISRYYRIIHKVEGSEIFYGSEVFDEELLENTMYNNQIFLKRGDLKRNGYFVVVMRMEPENSILEIVSAFKESTSDLDLVLIGPSTKFFERKVNPLIDRDERINFLGPIYDRTLLAALRSSAFAYIHGHTVGGTNPTLVEAIYLRRPIIAYGSVFNKEVLGKSGQYFKNAEELVRILEKGDDGLANPPEISADYTWSHVAQKYIDLIGDKP